MKNTIPRILISASLLSLIAGIVVTIIGLVLEWNTSRQFSDGLFWAGALLILVGFISYQGYNQRASDGPTVSLNPADHSNLWATDTSRGKNLMAFFGISGLLLFVLSFLVGRLF